MDKCKICSTKGKSVFHYGETGCPIENGDVIRKPRTLIQFARPNLADFKTAKKAFDTGYFGTPNRVLPKPRHT